ncbi:hypothetical protein JHK82_033915 [Glycine max]|nr:hypothetical protein JHK85_034627 [Glycine max]KAG4986305.1 hypothetical protein JHK86_033996 [Glycine max]KAG5119495.1 hypothetical protein JHK82_033915 [Glycine max]KAG5140486.1 hypothetical protein JHK84_034254 [Glycine max]
MLRSLHSSATYSTSHLSRGGYSTEPMLEQKVAELVREFPVFRGFTITLESYEDELRTGVDKDSRPNLLCLHCQQDS